ncbi:hypothetical protein GGR51DRAFT_578172 [Nemania sp. FL0031]|nr:hypothetical protein GGR51DRAFT_578172 [Nemania sp. FL0031]
MNPYKFAVTVWLFAQSILALDVASHCPEGQLCLTSFKQCEDYYEEGCCEPPGSYPWMASDDAVQLPALLGDNDYTLSWVFGPHGQTDIPVRIQWKMDSIVWETNTTDSEYIFNPGKILGSFPTPLAPNMTQENAWFNASQYTGNMLIISQPGAVHAGKEFPMTTSQPFTVQPVIIKDYIQTQIEIARKTESNKWKLGMGIGLGIGIPFLIVATTIGTLVMSRMQKGKQMNENTDEAPRGDMLY